MWKLAGKDIKVNYNLVHIFKKYICKRYKNNKSDIVGKNYIVGDEKYTEWY